MSGKRLRCALSSSSLPIHVKSLRFPVVRRTWWRERRYVWKCDDGVRAFFLSSFPFSSTSLPGDDVTDHFVRCIGRWGPTQLLCLWREQRGERESGVGCIYSGKNGSFDSCFIFPLDANLPVSSGGMLCTRVLLLPHGKSFDLFKYTRGLYTELEIFSFIQTSVESFFYVLWLELFCGVILIGFLSSGGVVLFFKKDLSGEMMRNWATLCYLLTITFKRWPAFHFHGKKGTFLSTLLSLLSNSDSKPRLMSARNNIFKSIDWLIDWLLFHQAVVGRYFRNQKIEKWTIFCNNFVLPSQQHMPEIVFCFDSPKRLRRYYFYCIWNHFFFKKFDF